MNYETILMIQKEQQRDLTNPDQVFLNGVPKLIVFQTGRFIKKVDDRLSGISLWKTGLLKPDELASLTKSLQHKEPMNEQMAKNFLFEILQPEELYFPEQIELAISSQEVLPENEPVDVINWPFKKFPLALFGDTCLLGERVIITDDVRRHVKLLSMYRFFIYNEKRYQIRYRPVF